MLFKFLKSKQRQKQTDIITINVRKKIVFNVKAKQTQQQQKTFKIKRVTIS